MKNTNKDKSVLSLKERVDNFLFLPGKTKYDLFVDKLCYVMIEEEWSPEKAFAWLQADKDNCIKNKFNDEPLDIGGLMANIKSYHVDKILDAYNTFLKHESRDAS